MTTIQPLRQPWPMPTAAERAIQDEYYARLNQTPLPAGDACAEINAAANNERAWMKPAPHSRPIR